jgi:co-chaperonin GroES (HSP10)
MKFKPYNRHVLLSEKEQTTEEEVSTVLIPDSYVTNFKPYNVYVVRDVSSDCEKLSRKHIKKEIVVNNSMVEKISIQGEELLLVLENHIYGVIDK